MSIIEVFTSYMRIKFYAYWFLARGDTPFTVTYLHVQLFLSEKTERKNSLWLRKLKQPNPSSISASSRSRVLGGGGGPKYWKIISNLDWKLRPASWGSLNPPQWRWNQPDCCPFPLAPHHRNVAICEKLIEVESKWLLGRDASISGSVLRNVWVHASQRFSLSTSLSLHFRLPLKTGTVFENRRERNK